MNKLILILIICLTNLTSFGQKKDKVLFHFGLGFYLNVNEESLITKQGVTFQGSASPLIYVSATFKNEMYMEVFYSFSTVQVNNFQLNSFQDVGLLVGGNMLSFNDFYLNASVGSYLRFFEANNLYQNGYRFGLSSKFAITIPVTEKEATFSIVSRNFFDVAGGENFSNQANLTRYSLGLMLGGNLNNVFKGKRYKSKTYY